MSEHGLRLAVGGLALAGVAVAGYLTYVHVAGIDPVCTGGGGCARVQASDQSELAGVPVALLGLLAYVVLLATAVVPAGDGARLAGALVALTGVGFSAYLTHQSLAVIEATCVWCLVSAGLMAALAVVSVARLLRAA